MAVLISAALFGFSIYLLTVALVLIAEVFFRRGVLMDVGRRFRAMGFMAIYIAAGAAFGAIAAFPTFTPLLPIAGTPGVLAGLLLVDFCYYWMHRAQHAVPLLWRFHKVHHSIEQMGAGTGYHHVSQIVIEALALALPVAIIIGPTQSLALGLILPLQGYYIHSTTRLHLGPLGRWIVDNRGHRIHHSRDPRHFNCNFGVPSLIWDRLFGTAWLPARDEWPATGLAGHREPRTVQAWLMGDL